jgi:hypothetical protein
MNRNDGRGAARDEFTRHVERYGVDPADIADGALWFLHKGGNKGEYKVHAQTWINRRAYEDGADDWRKLQASIAARQTQAGNVVPIRTAPKPGIAISDEDREAARKWIDRLRKAGE